MLPDLNDREALAAALVWLLSVALGVAALAKLWAGEWLAE